MGDAMVSEKHCNFLINTGNARATDLEALGEHVQKQVSLQCGIPLEWEIKRFGLKK
jgi:UDP-N-acetylmuramate dehydrogenase